MLASVPSLCSASEITNLKRVIFVSRYQRINPWSLCFVDLALRGKVNHGGMPGRGDLLNLW